MPEQLIGRKDQLIHSQPKLASALNEFVEFCSRMHLAAHGSSDLLSIGIKDQIAQETEKILEDPIKGLIQGNNLTSFVIWYKIIEFFDDNFNLHFSNDIISLYRNRLNSITDSLQYFIVLKEDTESNHDKLIDWLYIWNQKMPADNYPVLFHFVPQQSTDKIIDLEKII